MSVTTDSTNESDTVSRGYRLACRAWWIFAIALCVRNIISPTRRSLYPCYAAAAENWWRGFSLYDRRAIAFDYRYSPSFAILYTPFTWGPETLGCLLWGLALLFALWRSLEVFRRDLLQIPPRSPSHGIWLMLALLGTSHSLWSGQSNVLIIAGVLSAGASLCRQRWWTAAGLLAGLSFIKIWPAAFLLLVMLRFPRRLSIPALTWGALLALLPFLTQRSAYARDEYLEWWQTLRQGPVQERLASYDFWHVWEIVAPPVSETGYLILQISTLGALCLFAVWLGIRSASVPTSLLTLTFGWEAWQLALGPGLEKNTLSLITPLSSYLFVRAWNTGRQRGVITVGLVLTFLTIQINDTYFARLNWEEIRLLHPLGLSLLMAGGMAGRFCTLDEVSPPAV